VPSDSPKQKIPDGMPHSDVDFIGPFEHHDVRVKGRNVPLLTATPQGEAEILVVLDGRFGVELTVAEAERFVPFVADCIAVALGYTCHPSEDEEPRRSQPFVRAIGIVGFETGGSDDTNP
jgi:hypothetical protein